ncbi:S-(hydroxymethyl)glutathione dehydrogenase/alcohol dehydrogenase [Asanoa ferruginea]|uniref:S-(Hydroxymethyl)glutathione dehydrogenase/alcohol dehydrogenase n=1 Tax=Asanoa ferruginea TaxID=53367 RepID=A0A3D9ZVR9_9ACTN|nr:zinc-binding dehydrogenase [Asanoa ferruginea]REG00705.1 S-(hydroxymethyl)glutathione dehydrogenase/alcohol dehydrogenase [Asanoa ferruginea]GIF47421.1 alcohol dehydrogenase [Asanoa ferruginea]
MKALIVSGTREEPHVADVVLPPVGPGEVRVRIRAAGVCHSDLSMVNGTLAPSYPLVLGHEAAGVVIEVGPEGAGHRVDVGDHVVLNWAPPCRECWHCTHGEPWLCAEGGRPSAPRGRLASGEAAHVTLGLGALAEEVVVPSHAVIRVPADLPPDVAALLGCAVLTATGAVNRTAAVQAGQSVVVIGLGGVGLATLIAARAAGADPVIGVDLSEAKRDLALKAGASHFLPSDDTVPKAVRGLTGGRGADHAIECVGRSATIGAAWRATRRGGQVTVVGMGARDDLVSLGALDIFHSARTLRSSVYGSSDPDRDLPVLAAAVHDGSLDLSPLITDRISLEAAPDAFTRMARGEGARSVVLFD